MKRAREGSDLHLPKIIFLVPDHSLMGSCSSQEACQAMCSINRQINFHFTQCKIPAQHIKLSRRNIRRDLSQDDPHIFLFSQKSRVHPPSLISLLLKPKKEKLENGNDDFTSLLNNYKILLWNSKQDVIKK